FGFVHRCLREYHAKHRPGFIRSLSDIKVLSNSSGSDVEMLSGDGLLSFLSKLDSAVRGMVERIFNSNWDTVVGKVFSALEEGSLDDVSCKDFKDVLDIAGVPLVASSLVSRSKTQSLRTHTSNEDIDESTASGGGPSSSMTAEEMDTGGACAGAGVVCATVDGLLPIQCVDLLGVRVHPDSTKPIYGLFSGIRESAKMSYSSSILNHLLTTINSELSLVGRAIWCETYRELHLCSFIFRFLCIYHYKYRPDFIRLLPSIRVLSSSSDCKLVPLSGGSLLGFLSKLDVAILDEAKSVFISHWDKLAGKVFVEGGSLIDVSCGDFVNALDVAGVPAVAFSYFQRRRVGKRKISENSSKVTSEGTTSEDGNTGSVGSSSGLQLQSELSSLPEPDLLLEGGSSLPNVADYVAATSVSGESFLTPSDDLLASTDDGAVSNLEVLEGELLAPSFSPELIPESLLPPSLELEQVLMPPPFLHHHWLEKLD
ncbi:hypothetical protein, partial [Candidatus Ichthyocystis sparus]|uniref:hypothetical protein n=2 Tax=Candidatus Ichthyocystis sparus TaxID=1561004 RepID=UPI00159EEF2D